MKREEFELYCNRTRCLGSSPHLPGTSSWFFQDSAHDARRHPPQLRLIPSSVFGLCCVRGHQFLLWLCEVQCKQPAVGVIQQRPTLDQQLALLPSAREGHWAGRGGTARRDTHTCSTTHVPVCGSQLQAHWLLLKK